MMEPATGRLTPKRRVRCTSSGPYPPSTMPISRKIAAMATIARVVRTSGPRRRSVVSLHRQSVVRRRHRAFQQRIVRLAHPAPQPLPQPGLDLAQVIAASQVLLLEGIGLQVVELHDRRTVGRVARRVGPEGGAGLDVAR